MGLLLLALVAMSANDLGLSGRIVDGSRSLSPPAVNGSSGAHPGPAGPAWSATVAVARRAPGPAQTCRPDAGRADQGPADGPCPSAGGSTSPSTTGDAAEAARSAPGDAAPPGPGQAFDAGNIISDAVFYDRESMTDAQIESFIDDLGRDCRGGMCLKDLRIGTDDQPADRYCAPYAGGSDESAAVVIGKVSRACGVNPQVMLVTLQKESGLLTRSEVTASTDAAAGGLPWGWPWGWHCPDAGPEGTANCDPAYASFFVQAYGMAKQWSRYRNDPERYCYRSGQTAEILWNVAESGCGSAPVTIRNTATASLYNYTPYQPNAASLAGYPGPGDRCSSYGNRNFFFLFNKYFGSTGGGPAGAVVAAGVALTVPDNRFVDPAIAGRTITAPTAAVAAGLAAGLSTLGLPYVWGGGGSGAGPDNGCARGAGLFNSCGSEIGFDCSGLTAFVLGRAGFVIPGNSTLQRRSGDRIGWDRAMPGDVVGFPGHVAIYLGTIGENRFILEASWVGTPVHVTRLTRGDADPVVYRYWAATAVTQGSVAPPTGFRNGWSAPDPVGSGFVPLPTGRRPAAEDPPSPPIGPVTSTVTSTAGSAADPITPSAGTPLSATTLTAAVGATGTVGRTTSTASPTGSSTATHPRPTGTAPATGTGTASPTPTATAATTTTTTATATATSVPALPTVVTSPPSTVAPCTVGSPSPSPSPSTTPTLSTSTSPLSSTATPTDAQVPADTTGPPTQESILSAGSSVHDCGAGG